MDLFLGLCRYLHGSGLEREENEGSDLVWSVLHSGTNLGNGGPLSGPSVCR